MINVGMVIPGKDDATSFYRAWGAFSEMRKSLDVDVNLVDLTVVSWGNLIDMDVVFIQRPFNDSHVGIVQMAKASNIPVWCDWDDALWLLKKDNPACHLYQGCEKNIREIAAHSDVVTVSTGCLNKHLGGTVIRNELPRRFTDMFKKPSAKTDKEVRIVWRGGGTHSGDWMTHLPDAVDATKGKDVQWVLVGGPPFFVLEAFVSNGIKVGTVQEAYIEQYLTGIIRNDVIRGDIMFVPLRDTEFNRCKSNIAQLEGTAGGMVTVCPAWEEWQTGVNYDGSCRSSLERAIDMVLKGDHVQVVEQLQSRYRETRGSVERWKVLKGLCGRV